MISTHPSRLITYHTGTFSLLLTILLYYSNKAHLRVCIYYLESQPYICIKYNQLESYQERALRIIYGNQIKGMPYQNTRFLANLECFKDCRIKLSQSFFFKKNTLH